MGLYNVGVTAFLCVIQVSFRSVSAACCSSLKIIYAKYGSGGPSNSSSQDTDTACVANRAILRDWNGDSIDKWQMQGWSAENSKVLGETDFYRFVSEIAELDSYWGDGSGNAVGSSEKVIAVAVDTEPESEKTTGGVSSIDHACKNDSFTFDTLMYAVRTARLVVIAESTVKSAWLDWYNNLVVPENNSVSICGGMCSVSVVNAPTENTMDAVYETVRETLGTKFAKCDICKLVVPEVPGVTGGGTTTGISPSSNASTDASADASQEKDDGNVESKAESGTSTPLTIGVAYIGSLLFALWRCL